MPVWFSTEFAIDWHEVHANSTGEVETILMEPATIVKQIKKGREFVVQASNGHSYRIERVNVQLVPPHAKLGVPDILQVTRPRPLLHHSPTHRFRTLHSPL